MSNRKSFIGRLWNRRSIEEEMSAELEFHRDERASELEARGVSKHEARRRANIEFGGVESYREECRAALGYRLLDELRADLRYAARCMLKSRSFSAAAAAILALAIGANSILFTLFNNYVLRPLPVRGAERHVDITAFDRQGRRAGGWTAGELDALRQSALGRVEGLYTASTIQVLLFEPFQRYVLATAVSRNYFSLLGGVPHMGRTFGESDRTGDLAVLSHSGWRKLFGSDPAAVGRTLRVRSTIYTVIGVMGPHFTGVEMVTPDFWTPAEMIAALRGSAPDPDGPRYAPAGLLAPGVYPAELQAVLTAVPTRLPRPGREPVQRVEVRQRSSFFPMNDETSVISGLMFAVFLVVLLIACANLANLFLARAASRAHEIATRLSLGASRARLIRQLLTESTLIALLGAGAGLALCAFGIQRVQDYLFSLMIGMGMTVLPVSLDVRIFLHAAAMGLVAGVAFGLLPAIEATSPRLIASMKREHSPFAGRIRPRRMRSLLIGGQAAASLVLLILAGVLVRNIQRLDSTDPGYSLDTIFDVNIENPSPAFLDRLSRLDRVASLTSVERVPLYGRLEQAEALVGNRSVTLARNRVDHRYLETLAVPVLHGRGFTRQEAETGARVAVVSLATARKLWGSESPLGEKFHIGFEPGQAPGDSGAYEVIGIAPDLVSGWFFEGKDATLVYLPGTAGKGAVSNLMARAAGDPAAARAAIRALCAEAANGCETASLREVAALQRFPFQAAAAVAGALGALAILLTAVGLFGVVSFVIVQRKRELGVEAALGATPARILHRIIGDAVRPVLAGLATGLPLCLLLSKLAASSVFAIRTFDTGAYLAAPSLLVALSVLACLGPARRAAKADPMLSLREQ
jgi:predicted permease